MDFSDITGNLEETNLKETLDINSLFTGNIFRIDQIPIGSNWKYPPLFSEDIQGIKQWQILCCEGALKVVTIVNDITKIDDFKGNPRKEYIQKCKEGYFPPGNELSLGMNGCMLAKTYAFSKDKLSSNEARINKFPVSIMRKIDGIRAMTKIRDNKVEMVSRQGNLFVHLDHIKKEMIEFMRYLPPYCQLDGELYSLDLSFSELTSVVKTVKTKHSKHDTVEYWIFDILDPLNMSWEERYTMLVNAYSRYLEDNNLSNNFKIMQSYTVLNHEDILKYHDEFVKEGYEGIIIRRYSKVDGDLSKYKSGRVNNLLKYKSYKDEELEIISIENGITVKKGLLTFKIELRSDQKIMKKDIGKKLTVRYGSNGVVGIALRDYE